MKKRLISLIQFAIGIGLIAFIFARLKRSGNLHKIVDSLQAAADNWPLVVAGVLCFSVCMTVCTIRWYLILRAQDVNMPFRRVTALFFVGHFFNAFLFGATGGDVVKAYYVARETHHKKAEVIATVFIDRLIGLLALIGLTVVIMISRFKFFMTWPETRLAMLFNLVLLVMASGGLFVVFGQNVFERWDFFKRMEQRTALGAVIAKVYSAFHICLNHKGLLSKTILLSLVNHVMFIACPWCFGVALGVDPSFLAFLSVFPIINSVAALPITPGGLGTREGAAILLLGVLGVPEAAALTISLFVYATMLTWSLVGGVVYFFYSARRGKAVVEEGEAPAAADS